MSNENLPEVQSNEMGITTWSPSQVMNQVKLIQQVMEQAMQKDQHYGVVPGCGNKPTLLKAGAEKLMLTFRFSADYEELNVTEESDFISYRIKCILTHIPTGQVMGSGLGSCNSKEKKYAVKTVYASYITDEEKEESIGTVTKNGKVEKYILPQNAYDFQNTIYKMACKRALVAATLNATAASDMFTQDIEDMRDLIEKPTASNQQAPKATTEKSKEAKLDCEVYCPIGKNKGKKWEELDNRQLSWYRNEFYEPKIDDPQHAKFRDSNLKAYEAIKAIMEDRKADAEIYKEDMPLSFDAGEFYK